MPRMRSDDDIRKLVADLRDKADNIDDQAERVVRKSALDVKRGWQENVREIQHVPTSIPHYAKSISFDIETAGGETEAQVGPVKGESLPGRQAHLGAILEFGATYSPPYDSGGKALRAEADDFYLHMARIAGDVL